MASSPVSHSLLGSSGFAPSEPLRLVRALTRSSASDASCEVVIDHATSGRIRATPSRIQNWNFRTCFTLSMSTPAIRDDCCELLRVNCRALHVDCKIESLKHQFGLV